MKMNTRRALLKNAAAVAGASATGGIVSSSPAEAQQLTVWQKKVVQRPSVVSASVPATAPAPVSATSSKPLFNSIVTFGNLVFLAGIGAHFPGTIEEHTDHVLKELEQNLIAAGSSMAKVLKVNVYLSDLANYSRMNNVYAGRFGDVPPVRTTVAVVAGIPGNSLVEIDCIASL